MYSDVRGYVLAGGESSRMQRSGWPTDKASLVWQGETLLRRATTTLETVCETHGILCGNQERCSRLLLGTSGILDNFLGMGPLGGLEAALTDAEQRGCLWVLVIPVDLPHLTHEMLSAFLACALASASASACLRAAGHLQPLPALVRVDALPHVRELLLAGERKLLLALSEISHRLTTRGLAVIAATDLQCKGDSNRWFWNVNTPEDFLRMQYTKHLE